MTYGDYDFADTYNSLDTYDGDQPSMEMLLNEQGGIVAMDGRSVFPGAWG